MFIHNFITTEKPKTYKENNIEFMRLKWAFINQGANKPVTGSFTPFTTSKTPIK